MGMTMIEKILARASGADRVQAGEIVFASPHRVLSHDNSAAILGIFEKMEGEKVWDPDRIFIALDHAVPPPDAKKATNHKMIRSFVAKQNIANFYDCGVGICHQVLPEYGHVVPGVVIFGSDSHTTTHGALGAAGIPIGRTETASVWALEDRARRRAERRSVPEGSDTLHHRQGHRRGSDIQVCRVPRPGRTGDEHRRTDDALQYGSGDGRESGHGSCR